jgi:hypothetical protein
VLAAPARPRAGVGRGGRPEPRVRRRAPGLPSAHGDGIIKGLRGRACAFRVSSAVVARV